MILKYDYAIIKFMAKIDTIKERINLLKAIFISNLIAIFSMVAYLYKQQTLEDNFLVLIAFFIMLFVNILLYVRINKMIAELEDL